MIHINGNGTGTWTIPKRKVPAQCAATNLLDVAAQLAGLAEDLKALAARRVEPIPTLAEPDDQP
ncbi:hypothetical protein [Sinorhizobium meliloti]|uniref:hypothetical protein n=1 Tax=Rhizobium meliloti TaxID=382 RepID=UPI003B528458